MSTTSGIIPSETLVSDCLQFIHDDDQSRVLGIEIGSDLELKIDHKVSVPATANLDNDLNELSKVLSDLNKCYYIIIKVGEVNSFIAFIPFNAAVRQKMLYASTKNSLLNSVGTNLFTRILQVNSPDELSAQGWKAIVESDSVKPLSQSEIENQKFKTSNLLVSNDKRQLTNQSHSKLMLNINDSDRLVSLLRRANLSNNELVSLKIENESLFIKDDQQNIDINNLIDSLAKFNDTPTYNIYHYNDGNFFIYTCPSGSKVRDRMIYASNKQPFINELKSSWGWNFKSIAEIGDAIELDVSEIKKDEVETDTTNSSSSSSIINKSLGFSKPKGPRRRK